MKDIQESLMNFVVDRVRDGKHEDVKSLIMNHFEKMASQDSTYLEDESKLGEFGKVLRAFNSGISSSETSTSRQGKKGLEELKTLLPQLTGMLKPEYIEEVTDAINKLGKNSYNIESILSILNTESHE